MIRLARGVFITIEGTDGSGKATQSKRVVNMLRRDGYSVLKYDFPRYEEPSAWFVTEYLKGKFGTLEEIGPRKASLFYALDRFAAAPKIHNALTQGRIVVSDRFVASNLAHQGSKIADETERQHFMHWAKELEFDILDIPKPNLNIILFVTPEISQQLVDQKKPRAHLRGKKRDIHEANLKHLTKTYNVYRELVQRDPKYYRAVECVEDGKLLSVPAVFEKVCDEVRNIRIA
jgi:dTMP kinase